MKRDPKDANPLSICGIYWPEIIVFHYQPICAGIPLLFWYISMSSYWMLSENCVITNSFGALYFGFLKEVIFMVFEQALDLQNNRRC